jgi:hypothetical protein
LTFKQKNLKLGAANSWVKRIKDNKLKINDPIPRKFKQAIINRIQPHEIFEVEYLWHYKFSFPNNSKKSIKSMMFKDYKLLDEKIRSNFKQLSTKIQESTQKFLSLNSLSQILELRRKFNIP